MQTFFQSHENELFQGLAGDRINSSAIVKGHFEVALDTFDGQV